MDPLLEGVMILAFDVHALERIWPKQRRQGLKILLMEVEYARAERQNERTVGTYARGKIDGIECGGTPIELACQAPSRARRVDIVIFKPRVAFRK